MWGKRYYDQWADRVNGYLNGLNIIGVKASLMSYDDPDVPKRNFLEQMTIGGTKEACIKVWDKNINFIELWRMEGKGGPSVNLIYLVRTNTGSSEKELNASWTAPFTSFLKGGMRGYRWEGGQLADQLNSDFSLSDKLMPYQRAIKVRAKAEHQYVMIMENFMRANYYPYPETQYFEAMDKIGDHIRMMAGTSV